MEGQGLHRAVIEPLPSGAVRPLWSVMIPVHNCARHLPAALESVLRQDPGPDRMQIEVIDDHSTLDDPEKIVREVAGDRVAFYRQPRQVGHVGNFETALKRSRGHLVHQLHGDDCVRDGFYEKLEKAFTEHPELGAAWCRTILMDEDGHWDSIVPLESARSGVIPDLLVRLAEHQRINTPAIAVRREVYETLGGFDRRLLWTEDWEMWARIAAHYPVWYETEPLALYRRHGTSNTSVYLRTGENVSDQRRALRMIAKYLPAQDRDTRRRQGLRRVGRSALRSAQKLLADGLPRAALAQTKEALRCDPSLVLTRKMLRQLPRLALTNISQGVRNVIGGAARGGRASGRNRRGPRRAGGESRWRRVVHRVLPSHTAKPLGFELRMALLRARTRLAPPDFANHSNLMVNIGAGKTGRSGWVNVDGARRPGINCRIDARRGLPFSSETVAGIFTEHFLEHLDYGEEVPLFLSECCRVLRPGGVLRVVVPDAGRYLEAYARGGWDELAALRPLDAGHVDHWFKNAYDTRMELINAVFRQDTEHKFAWDGETLELSLRRAGFSSAARREFGESEMASLCIDREDRASESLYVEARK